MDSRDKFWDKWHRWGRFLYSRLDDLKQEMFEDLEKVCEEYHNNRVELGNLLTEVNEQTASPVQYYDVPDELLGLGHIWHFPRKDDYTTALWICSLCGCDSDDNDLATKRCEGGANCILRGS